jgi:hypothetical protein
MTTQTLEVIRQVFNAEWTAMPTVDESTAQAFVSLFINLYPVPAIASGSRLQSAARIMRTPGARQSAGNGVYLVQSEHNHTGWYQVDINARTCTCPDHPGITKHKGLCKHRLSIGLALHGPAWLLEVARQKAAEQNAHMRHRQVLEAHDRAEAAWDKVLETTDRWEYFVWRVGPDDTATKSARVEMDLALRHANQLAEFARSL